MDFEQDYLLRIIKQMAAFIMNTILGKKSKVMELPLEDQYRSSKGLLHDLLDMVNNGLINEAENKLLDELDPDSKEDIEDAVLFYSYLNELSNEELQKCNFSREEVDSGLKSIAKLVGIDGFSDIFKELD